MARLGQCFSTSLDTIGITLQEGVRYREIVDVELRFGRTTFCFSDGIGTISPGLASEVIGHCLLIDFRVMNMTLKIYFTHAKLTECSTCVINTFVRFPFLLYETQTFPIVDFSCASRVFLRVLRFSSLSKINTLW